MFSSIATLHTTVTALYGGMVETDYGTDDESGAMANSGAGKRSAVKKR